jgi:hypothetical protein
VCGKRDVHLVTHALEVGCVAHLQERLSAAESSLREAREEAEGLRKALRLLVKDLDDLAAESDGVAGLHRNGDVADWDWLRGDGAWLESWEAARAALAAKGEG